ncbi:MAG: hypothetical protein KGI06_01770 [Candidatus Micrarchaeota archaeon]|nr:hypothetical protein [Candidatus Micrarchaeota archaeon]
MAFLKKGTQSRQGQGRPSNRTIAVAALVVIIVVAALYYFVFLNVSQTIVKAPAVANLSESGTVFSVDSQQYLISLAGESASSGIAYVHVDKLPIFVNPPLNVTLTINNITKINAGTQYANMGIQLEAIGQNSVTVKVSPLFTSLQISPDSQYIRTMQGSLYSQSQPKAQRPSNSTITVATSTTSTSASTTTMSQASAIAADINSTLDADSLYLLLLNFSALYANTTGCTPTLYSEAYIRAYGSAPGGPNDYANVSYIVPYNMSLRIAGVGRGDYNATFTTHARGSFYNNVVAASIEVNASTKSVLGKGVNSKGIFAGQTSISQLQANYYRALGYGSCGVYV